MNDLVLLPGPEELQRQASDPAASVWVAASAGTGKTKVLTDRTLRLMLGGTAPSRILCLTFTKAAAAEMANRIAATLGGWATAEDDALEAALAGLLGRPATAEERGRARRLFASVLDAPGGMHIQTIHSFCQSLLGRFPLEAGVAPHFAVLDERDAADLLDVARRRVLARAQGDRAGGGPLAVALERITAHIGESGFAEVVAALAADRGRLRRFIESHRGVAGAVAAVEACLGLPSGADPAGLTAAACEEDAFDGAGLRAVVRALEATGDGEGARAVTLAGWLAAAPAARAATIGSYRQCFLTADGEVRKRLVTKALAAAMPGAQEVLQREAERLKALDSRCRAAVTASATAGLLALGEALLAEYAAEKAALARLDYDDLILETLRLLTRRDVAAWVLFKLDGGIDHILIDEAQDTNPEQWRIVEALAGEFFAGEGAREVVRTVFAVGDVKQSIYSFQRADPEAFRRMRDHFAKAVPAAGLEWRQVALDVSFRSTEAVLAAVDAVFGSAAAARGVDLDGAAIRHRAQRRGQPGLVEIWPAVAPRETDAPPPWKPPVERVPGDSPQLRLARLVARRIHSWLGVERLEARARTVRAGDVMVLVRRRTAFVAALVRALKEFEVPVAGVDRMALTEQLAVMDLMALAGFLLLPEDDLTLATVLKGPLAGLDEDDLFRLANGRSGSLWAELRRRAGEAPGWERAATLLSGLLARVDQVPPFELFSHVLGPLRGRERLLARLGPDAADPLAVFMDLALAYERGHVASLQGFLRWLQAGDVEIKRDLEQGAGDAVRILTVHGAKGLQAPIVILPDTLQAPRPPGGLLWPRDAGGREVLLWPPRRAFCEERALAERERLKRAADDEYRRLLYVAMTRAEDRLYACGWETRKQAPEGCWYHLLRDGLAGIAETLEDPFLAAAPEAEGARVLRLRLGDRAASGTKAEPAGEASPALPEWAFRPPPSEPDPPRPLAPSRPGDGEPPVVSPLDGGDGARFRRGALVHRLLQTLPELPAERRRAAASAYLARPAHGLLPLEQAALANETLAVLEHPEYAALFGPGSRAEAAIAGLVGGKALSARVDRLLADEAEVMVIDYKTNRPPPRDAARVPPVYLRQMAAYRAALRAIYPGRRVRCLLLWTDGPRLMELADSLLDSHVP